MLGKDHQMSSSPMTLLCWVCLPIYSLRSEISLECIASVSASFLACYLTVVSILLPSSVNAFSYLSFSSLVASKSLITLSCSLLIDSSCECKTEISSYFESSYDFYLTLTASCTRLNACSLSIISYLYCSYTFASFFSSCSNVICSILLKLIFPLAQVSNNQLLSPQD